MPRNSAADRPADRDRLIEFLRARVGAYRLLCCYWCSQLELGTIALLHLGHITWLSSAHIRLQASLMWSVMNSYKGSKQVSLSKQTFSGCSGSRLNAPQK